jgi:hypothetical protein
MIDDDDVDFSFSCCVVDFSLRSRRPFFHLDPVSRSVISLLAHLVLGTPRPRKRRTFVEKVVKRLKSECFFSSSADRRRLCSNRPKNYLSHFLNLLYPPNLQKPTQQSNSAGLVVISEEDTRTLLIHRLCAASGGGEGGSGAGSDSSPSTYSRQGDGTIISWPDAALGTDVALSFQDAAGSEQVWSQIQKL